MAVDDYSRESFDRQDAEAVLRVRRELGAEYDTELVNAFAERIERAVEARAQESRYAVKSSQRAHPGGGRQFALGLFSLIFGLPITAAANESTSGLIVVWLGIVGVNAAHAWQTRHK